MNSTTIRISTETVIEKARLTSSSQAGIGRMRTVRMKTRPPASRISPRRSVFAIWLSHACGPAFALLLPVSAMRSDP
jgi:hypothetical protein